MRKKYLKLILVSIKVVIKKNFYFLIKIIIIINKIREEENDYKKGLTEKLSYFIVLIFYNYYFKETKF